MEPEVAEDTSTDELVAPADDSVENTNADSLVEEELLVEEISIDGMCGVY